MKQEIGRREERVERREVVNVYHAGKFFVIL